MRTLLLPLILMIAFTQSILACSCGIPLLDLPIKEMGWTQTESNGISNLSDLIFTGILLETKNVEEQAFSGGREYMAQKVELVFKLIKSYKGDSWDTLRVRTNLGSDACGFYAPIGTEAIIFADRKDNGLYYTYRSDCCKSISKAEDEKRYDKYVRFLESITNMIDGEYVFKQTRTYWKYGGIDTADTLALMEYSIRNGKFEGLWKITDRLGNVLEEGKYQNGKRVGIWVVKSFMEKDYKGYTDKTEKIKYRNGRPHCSKVVIEDQVFNYGAEAKSLYKTVRIQKIRKRFH